MKKYVILLLLVVGLCSAHAATTAPDGESLNYRVMYKWGLVNKQAGTVNIRVKHNGKESFTSILTAKSERWADKFYKVRDTLVGKISLATCEPTLYEKISHEGGEFKHDKITYTRTGNKTKGHCLRLRRKKADKPLTSNEITLESAGLTLDMLSSFFYMRSIDFSKKPKGATESMTVFSGKRKETLTITYKGIEVVKIDDKRYQTFHITFRFTGEGGKKTSDDMSAWITTTANRIPVKLEGSLPVGKVQCFLIP